MSPPAGPRGKVNSRVSAAVQQANNSDAEAHSESQGTSDAASDAQLWLSSGTEESNESSSCRSLQVAPVSPPLGVATSAAVAEVQAALACVRLQHQAQQLQQAAQQQQRAILEAGLLQAQSAGQSSSFRQFEDLRGPRMPEPAMSASPLATPTPGVIPDFAQAMQPKILKQINSYNNKEDLLVNMTSCHQLLDAINLTTCIYRLARMYNNVRGVAARRRWSSELLHDFMFHTLLRTMNAHLIQAQLQLVQQPDKFRGFDARCVSNLVWALVKLEVSTEPGTISHDVIQNVSLLVLHFLPTSSGQGLANLLWAYSKMSDPVLHVMMMIISEMTARLQTKSAHFDAQALSNSIWALAHVRSRVANLDGLAGMPGLTMRFMTAVANAATRMLRGLQTRSDLAHMQASMLESERRFSCQALVNICWSFATLLGEDVSSVPAIRALFSCIRAEALVRLHANAAALQLNQTWVLRLPGGFNEQALSNIVYAFDKTQLLDTDMLQSVYTVASLRLDRSVGRPMFKPQELCTLLRAAQSNIAQPWAFLQKLHAILLMSPDMVRDWSAAERAELDRALALLDMYHTTGLLEQMKLEQDHAVSQAAAAQASLSALSPGW